MRSLGRLVFYGGVGEHSVEIRYWDLATIFIVLAFPIHPYLLRCFMWLTTGFKEYSALTPRLDWWLYHRAFTCPSVILFFCVSNLATFYSPILS